MGTSTSKKNFRDTAILSRQYQTATSDCECLPFRLQPFCVANRHMHAYIEPKSLDICIVDLTFMKRFLIKDVIDPSQPLQNKASLPPGLTNCNMIAFHWDLAVLQIFYRKTVQFCVCNLSSQICTYRYEMCSCFKRRPGLCEAYFSANRQYLILKPSDLYYTMFSTLITELEHSFIEVAKLDEVTVTSNHYVIPNIEATPFGLCPDPNRPAEMYIARWKCFISSCTGNGIYMYSDISVLDVSIPFKRKSKNKSGSDPIRLHVRCDIAHTDTETSVDRSRLVNIQIPRNSNFILQSTTSKCIEKSLRPNAAREYVIHVELRQKTPGSIIHRTWTYDSSTGTQLDWPKLSPSGAYAVIGDQMCLISDKSCLKSLSTICADLLTELVLSEDVQFLPLPEKLKDGLRYGNLERHRKLKFTSTSV